MKNLVKLKVIFLMFFIIFTAESTAAELILPAPKPSVDEDIKKKVEKKKEIYPQKKPIKKIEEKTDDINQTAEIEENKIIIYPQKKPTIVKKQVSKALVKSEILSKSDYKIAKNAFELIFGLMERYLFFWGGGIFFKCKKDLIFKGY